MKINENNFVEYLDKTKAYGKDKQPTFNEGIDALISVNCEMKLCKYFLECKAFQSLDINPLDMLIATSTCKKKICGETKIYKK